LITTFKSPATTDIYTLSLHDALPIFTVSRLASLSKKSRGSPQILSRRPTTPMAQTTLAPTPKPRIGIRASPRGIRAGFAVLPDRSEEHTSELQSRSDLVCRLLLEKKK